MPTTSQRKEHNYCPAHPNEPVTGMCGCGRFFCQRCSPSTVFCRSCYEGHKGISEIGGSLALVQAGGAADPVYDAELKLPERSLTQRIIIEAFVLTVVSLVLIASLLSVQSRSMSNAADDDHISYGLNLSRDPVQKNATSFQKTINLDDGGYVDMTSHISYSISAKVESVQQYSDTISSAAPFDLLLAWGEMANSDVDSKLTWHQGDRRGEVSGSLGEIDGYDLDTSYVIAHMSNNHIIPANRNVRQGLALIKPGDTVRVDGRLVNIKMTEGNRYISVNTSISRTDQGDGACEIIYAEHLRVNDRQY